MKTCFNEQKTNHIIASEGVTSQEEMLDLWQIIFDENVTRILTLCEIEEKTN